MNELKRIKIGQIGFSIVCGIAFVYVAVESKRLGTTQRNALIWLAGVATPYIIKYLENKIKERDQQIKEQIEGFKLLINELRSDIRSVQKDLDERVDDIETEIPKLTDIVERNRDSVTLSINSTEQLRGEIYSARGEAQNAAKIASVALDLAKDAQDRINYVLNSGSVNRLTEKVTCHDLKLAILEKRLKEIKKQFNSNPDS